MKKLLIGLLSMSLLAACSGGAASTGNVAVSAADAPKIKFDDDAFDFGKIQKGAKVTHEFRFANIGKSPLVISNAQATCGCTTPEWPKAPVKPGENGVVKVTFDSATKSGLQDKMITVTANTVPAQTVVHLVGEVLEKK